MEEWLFTDHDKVYFSRSVPIDGESITAVVAVPVKNMCPRDFPCMLEATQLKQRDIYLNLSIHISQLIRN